MQAIRNYHWKDGGVKLNPVVPSTLSSTSTPLTVNGQQVVRSLTQWPSTFNSNRKVLVMFNPNSNEQIMQSVKSDLGFIGMVIADEVTNPDWYSFTVGNQSIQFAHITFFNQRITIRANGKTYRTIEYRGSLEKFGEDVCTKIVKLALKKNL